MPYLFVHALVFLGEIIVLFLRLLLCKEIVTCRDILILGKLHSKNINIFIIKRQKNINLNLMN